MGSYKFLCAFFILILAIGSYAQESPPQPPVPETNAPSFPFRDGETIIEDIEYKGLDVDLDGRDHEQGPRIHISDFRRGLYGQGFTRLNRNEIHWSDVEKLRSFLKEWLVNHGYLNAKIVTHAEELSRNRIKLIVSVERGAPVLVSDIQFVGLKNVRQGPLLEAFKKCLGDGPLVFDKRRYDYYAEKSSKSVLFSMGYLKSKVGLITSSKTDKALRVTIKVDEGDRYRWGEIKFKNAHVFTEQELLEILGQRSGDVADGSDIEDFLFDRLKHAYGERGYVQYTGEFDPEFIPPLAEGLDGTVNVLIQIEEGRPFSVRKIEFAGVESNVEKQLKEQMTLKSGDLFVPSRLDADLKSINDTNRFRFVDKDRDVGIRTDEESAELDFVILIKPL